MNEQIKYEKVRVVNFDGEQLGIMPTTDAIKIAKDQNLDLVEIQPKANPPVTKIMNYGKFKFSINKKKILAQKKQKDLKIKEIKFRPGTAENDYITKIKNITNFLKNGNKTKITISFKGREINYKDKGTELMTKICNDLSEISKIETPTKLEGKNITTIIRPIKKREKKNEKD